MERQLMNQTSSSTTIVNRVPSFERDNAAERDDAARDGLFLLVGVAIWLTTNSPSTLVDRGNEYLRRGEYKRAIQSYDEALRLDPAYRDAFNARGNATAVLIL